MINGFETPSQVQAQLDALARERTGGAASDPRVLAVIEEQEDVFRAELERMEAEGVQEPAKTATTEKWVGLAWTGGPWGQGFSSHG